MAKTDVQRAYEKKLAETTALLKQAIARDKQVDMRWIDLARGEYDQPH